MDPLNDYKTFETRRQFFGKTARMGLGAAVGASLLPHMNPLAAAAHSAQTITPKAKRAIYLFLAGAPPQMDTLDYKPKMAEWYDKELPDYVRRGQRITTMTSKQKRFPVAPSVFKFKQYGKSGMWISELLQHTAGIADDIAVINTMHTEAINHDPGITYFCTGSEVPGKPSLGAWLSYGLGSLNRNLPSFVVLNSTWTGVRGAQALYNRLWGSGFLPSKYQGVAFQQNGDPVLFLSNPKGVDRNTRRKMLDLVAEMNEKRYKEVGDPEIHTNIAQQEMAFRMQSSVPELTDISNEPKNILDMYGPDVHKPGTFARNCLLARRMMERDVRFVQIFHRGWDVHSNAPAMLRNQCRDIDQPSAALVTDLKQRGLLDDTLVVCGGEFGRTIYTQGKLTKTNYGRDHHPRCFSIWAAGAGVKGGTVHGKTDDFGYNIINDSGEVTTRFKDGAVHVRDLNATILHQLGIDHRKLSVKFQGLDQRLTGVEESHIVHNILR